MVEFDNGNCLFKDPIYALHCNREDGVLAIIINVDGPSYRPIGAFMAIFENGHKVGTLSSGCIESDLIMQSKSVLKSGLPFKILYGRGSPFIDLHLPCGGGLEILLVPRPDKAILAEIDGKRVNRVACTLVVNCTTGDLTISDLGETGPMGQSFQIRLEPDIFFYVFGKGPEASTFCSLVQSAGYPNHLFSPDAETIKAAEISGCNTTFLKSARIPQEVIPDEWSAIILFFHDHDWEPKILKRALETPAFYIGAQGSQLARDARQQEMLMLGVKKTALQRLNGPIGLIPSARDARTLAVSVMAEVLNVANCD